MPYANDNPNRDPKAVWDALLRGNQRFASDCPLRPNQDLARRAELTEGQAPRVCVLTCSDSRVPVEILFDAGFGDVFVIRTAGEVVDSGVLASLEFAVLGLQVELIVVLGHESCGAVDAALSAINGEGVPKGHQRTLVEQIAPSVLEAKSAGKDHRADYERYHAEAIVHKILNTSPLTAQALNEGRIGMVAARYRLSDGTVETVETLGLD